MTDWRERIGRLLCVEQKVVLCDDAEQARATAVGALSVYVTLPNYRNSWLRLGFTDEQIDAHDPEFLDAVVAWGDAAALQARVQEHLDAGADHVCIQVIEPDPSALPRDAWRTLAPALLG